MFAPIGGGLQANVNRQTATTAGGMEPTPKPRKEEFRPFEAKYPATSATGICADRYTLVSMSLNAENGAREACASCGPVICCPIGVGRLPITSTHAASIGL